MKRNFSWDFSSICVHFFLVCTLMLAHETFVYAKDTKQSNTNIEESGLSRLFYELNKCCRCHIEKWKAGNERLANVASYTRHRSADTKKSRCRTHVGNSMCEHDASTCPDHADKRVQRLLELCRSAVTYHLPTGEIDIVEADPIAGKRDRMHAGPYAERITEKPLVHCAQICKIPEPSVTPPGATHYVRLLDSSDRVLMVFECLKPLKQIETDTGIVYLIDQHMLNKAQQYVDTNGVTMAVEVEPQQPLYQRSKIISQAE